MSVPERGGSRVPRRKHISQGLAMLSSEPSQLPMSPAALTTSFNQMLWEAFQEI